MAKKKKSVDLSQEELYFEIEQERFKALRFYPSNMTVDVMCFVEGKKSTQRNLPFSHLPKRVKQLIKPK